MPFASKSIRDRARRRIAQQVKAGAPCCFCGQPIDLDLTYPDPLSFVVDHRVPTSQGGNDWQANEQLRPAHNWCNRQRSDQLDGSVGSNSGVLG